MNSRPPQPRKSSASLLFEGGLLLLASIALAAVFNQMNPKQIPWVKKEYERTQATQNDIDKYLAPADPTGQDKPVDAIVNTPTVAPARTEPTAPVTTTAPAASPVSEKPKNTFVADPGKVLEIGHDAFVRLMSSGPFHLIDARGPEKFAEGHIPGAVNIYGGEAQTRVPDIIQSPRDRIILIYCDGGECELSHHVADVLKQFNYGPIFIYTGGWAEWKTKH